MVAFGTPYPQGVANFREATVRLGWLEGWPLLSICAVAQLHGSDGPREAMRIVRKLGLPDRLPVAPFLIVQGAAGTSAP